MWDERFIKVEGPKNAFLGVPGALLWSLVGIKAQIMIFVGSTLKAHSLAPRTPIFNPRVANEPYWSLDYMLFYDFSQ